MEIGIIILTHAQRMPHIIRLRRMKNQNNENQAVKHEHWSASVVAWDKAGAEVDRIIKELSIKYRLQSKVIQEKK